MACTPEQIEQKRKLALEKLNAKKIKLTNTDQHAIPSLKNQPLHQFNGNNIKKQQSFNPQQKCSPPTAKNEITTQQFFGQGLRASCYLISETRFEINVHYHAQTIDIFKTIPSRRYNTVNKYWNFDMKDYELLVSKLKVLQPEVVVEKIPNYVYNLFKRPKTDYSSEINLEKIEPEILNILMPFQKDGVRFGIKHNGRCLIADDMGLGKTLQALAIASYYKQDWPLLIVTTSSMRNTWEQTIYKYLPSIPLAYVRYMSTSKDYINDATILIVSHDMMSRCAENLTERGFKFLIIDESHTIKNFKTKCTKSAIALSKRMKRVILLSGTPALSRPSELYSQLSIIDDRFFGNFMEFSRRYCDGKSSSFGWDSSGKSNLTELEIVLGKHFMIRRTKTEVLTSLPDKTREVIKLDVGLNRLTDKERLCLNALVDNYVGKKAQEKHSALLSLFAESARIKIPSVCVYIENILTSNAKFLVFAHHQVMLDAICKVLNQNNKQFIRIDGHTNAEQRKYFIDKFQLNDSCIAAVLSITAANAGITLTAASVVVFAELHWNPSILSQAESRAHRIGQVNDVTVRYLLGAGTVDDHIWPLLLSKQNVLSEVGLNKDSFKDTNVTQQIVNNFDIKTNKIDDYFERPEADTSALVSENNCESLDEALMEFLTDDNDDMFVNADF